MKNVTIILFVILRKTLFLGYGRKEEMLKLLIGVITFVGVLIYLFYALLNAEKL